MQLVEMIKPEAREYAVAKLLMNLKDFVKEVISEADLETVSGINKKSCEKKFTLEAKLLEYFKSDIEAATKSERQLTDALRKIDRRNMRKYS